MIATQAERYPFKPKIDEVDDTRRRYFDKELDKFVVQVFQGDFYTTNRTDEVLSTVLGSCIAACVRDPISGYGGMNHFLLPDIPASEQGASGSLRYGSFAMEQLVNAILSRGGKRERLEVKVFGGGNVVKGLSGVGHRNSDFIENFLKNEGIPVMSSDLRGSFARRVQYMPSTGQVRMRKLADDAARRIHKKETAKSVKTKVVEDTGSIELFD